MKSNSVSASYDFPVEVAPIFTGEGDKQREISRRKAIVRSDTGDVLSVISSKYQILEHKAVLNGVREALGDMKYEEKIQVSGNGRNFLMTADFPVDHGIEVARGDLLSLRIMARNSYDGGSAFQLILGAVRLVCTNGMTGFTHAFQYSQRHVGTGTKLGVKTEELAKGIMQLSEQFRSMQPHFAGMKDVQLSTGDIAGGAFEDGRVALPSYLLDEAFSEFNREKDYSKWGYYNALTFAITHKMRRESPEAQLRYGRIAWQAAQAL